MHYAPEGRTQTVVCAPGECVIAAAYFDHGHIYGMVANLVAAGATLGWIFEPDDAKARAMQRRYPEARRAKHFDEILNDSRVRMIATAAIPCLRAEIGVRVIAAGKDYFTDKCPFTTLDQLQKIRAMVASTGQIYAVCYSERLQNEATEHALNLAKQGVIGDVVQVLGLGPHRLSAPERPPWFFVKDQYGGIICDLGSHQVEQFLSFTGSSSGKVNWARAVNLHHPEYPELEDFGEAAMTGRDGAAGYFRVDWFTPKGLRTWGDGRLFVQGTKGSIECRKYVDVGAPNLLENVVIVVTESGEERHEVTGRVGFPYFSRLITDCLERQETAMTQAHTFLAAELALKAQQLADA
jgi:predicted dehydrogenase